MRHAIVLRTELASEFWDSMSAKQKRLYIKEHPNSKYANEAITDDAEPAKKDEEEAPAKKKKEDTPAPKADAKPDDGKIKPAKLKISPENLKRAADQLRGIGGALESLGDNKFKTRNGKTFTISKQMMEALKKEGHLTEKDGKLVIGKGKVAKKDAAKDKPKEAKPTPEEKAEAQREPTPGQMSSQEFDDLEEEVLKLNQEYVDKRKELGPEHPEAKELREKIDKINKRLDDSQTQLMKARETDPEQMEKQVHDLNKQYVQERRENGPDTPKAKEMRAKIDDLNKKLDEHHAITPKVPPEVKKKVVEATKNLPDTDSTGRKLPMSVDKAMEEVHGDGPSLDAVMTMLSVIGKGGTLSAYQKETPKEQQDPEVVDALKQAGEAAEKAAPAVAKKVTKSLREEVEGMNEKFNNDETMDKIRTSLKGWATDKLNSLVLALKHALSNFIPSFGKHGVLQYLRYADSGREFKKTLDKHSATAHKLAYVNRSMSAKSKRKQERKELRRKVGDLK